MSLIVFKTLSITSLASGDFTIRSLDSELSDSNSFFQYSSYSDIFDQECLVGRTSVPVQLLYVTIHYIINVLLGTVNYIPRHYSR